MFIKNKSELPNIAFLKQYHEPFAEVLVFLVEENELVVLEGANYWQMLEENQTNEMIHMMHANLSVPA